MQLADELGNMRVNNVVLLGALSAFLALGVDEWLEVIGRRVPPRLVELNQRAFHVGRQVMCERLEGVKR
jgi:indolepyruvate ferredoxin oxidoreductase beta subunit